jgi:Flp pilus assembly protein TadG
MPRLIYNSARRVRRLRRDEHAAVTVEFAVVVLMMFVLIFACIEFGHAFWMNNVLSAAVREGARTGAVQLTTSSTTDQDRAKQAAADYINNAFSLSGANALTTSDVTYAYDATSGQITVTLNKGGSAGYPISTITPFASQFGFVSSFRFQPRAVFRWEQAS